MIEALISLIFPGRCFSCGESVRGGEYVSLCDKCAGGIKPIREISENVCECCGRAMHGSRHRKCFECKDAEMNFIDNRSLMMYREYEIRTLVHRLKFENNRSAGIDLANLLREELTRVLKGNTCLVTPVPLSGRSLRARGFNQVELILTQNSVPYSNTLVRLEHYRAHSRMGRRARIEEVKGQFGILPGAKDIVNGANILLVDDIYTTGSTVNECSGVLKKNGANSVRTLTFFRD